MGNEINNNEENNFLAIASLGAIFGFIIPLIMWIVKNNAFSDYTKNFLTDLLNFELLILFVYLALNFIPFLGWILSSVVFVLNLVVALRCFSATKERGEYSFPFNIKIIQ